MGFSPFNEKGIPAEKQAKPWGTLNVRPYDKSEVDPYTRCRVILMNGIEVEAAMFLHQFNRHTDDPDLKQKLSLARRAEQQQQKMVNWLIPADESTLEVTIGYEQLAVDLTSVLAQMEPDPYVKQALDFALLEDFDHLYRYANLLEMDQGVKAERIVGGMTEIMPGRPTIVEHRHPFDEIRKHYNSRGANPVTKVHVGIITAAEQQTMNFYMTVGNRYPSMLGRGLYLEIGQIEEQHVTHYESLADPTISWGERLALHDYTECFTYYSCMESEPDPRIKSIWEEHMMMEVGHLEVDREILRRYEKREIEEMFPTEFPEPMKLGPNKEYVRQVLESQIHLASKDMDFVPVLKLPSDYRYYTYQSMVNRDSVPSNDVIGQHVRTQGMDYRFEEGEHPIKELRDRKLVDQEKVYGGGRVTA